MFFYIPLSHFHTFLLYLHNILYTKNVYFHTYFKVVDISAWQENLNWQALKRANIKGVIIKIGEYHHLDDMFITHVNNAVAYNLPYGIYYYAHTAIIDKANWVDMQIKTYLNGQNPPLGIWYDAEDKSMLKYNINVAYMIGNFINRLNELNYNYVGLYSSYNWLINIIDLNLLADYVPIWTAQYYHENSFKLEYPNHICKMWQYTNCKKIDDICLDCNIYYE